MPTGSKSKRRVSAGGGGGGGASTQHACQPPPTPPYDGAGGNNNETANLTSLQSGAALVCSVVEVDPRDGDFSATLWMPEASMLSASLSASQLVAVSVCLRCSDDLLETSRVENLEKRCSRHFGIVINDHLKDGPGSYCVIASAWPCRKLKDGVRVSKQLACALGCSQSATQVCLSPIAYPGLDHLRRSKLNSTAAMEVNMHDCQELVLKWCPVEVEEDLVDAFGSVKSMPERQHQLKTKTDFVKRGVENLSPSKNKHAADCDPKPPQMKEAGERQQWQSKEQAPLSYILEDENSRASKLLERFAGRLLHGRYLLKGNIVGIPVCGQSCIFQVVDAKSSLGPGVANLDQGRISDLNGRKLGLAWTCMPNMFLIGSKTQIKLVAPAVHVGKQVHMDVDATHEKSGGVSVEPTTMPLKRLEYSTLGGLSEQITTLKEIIKFSLLQPERLMNLGLQPPHGVLLHGPPGTGKTSLALASVVEAGVKIFPINGPEIISEYYGESEAALQAVFIAAQKAAPSVVFIDELDAIAPQRTEGAEDLGRRMVATLLTLMDGGGQNLQRVLVIAATNRVEVIDPALRRPGRFDREIEIGVPSPSGRCEILLSLLSTMSHALTKEDIDTLAAATHGFVGADLTSLCNEAAMVALRHYVHKKIKTEFCTRFQEPTYGGMNGGSVSSKLSDATVHFGRLNLTSTTSDSGHFYKSLMITMDDFEEAKTRVRPSAMREVMLEVPKVHWADIGGQEEIKQQLQEAVEWPQKHMDAFLRIGTQPPRGVLLYGPPGCSKTLMARAVATEAGLNFIAVKGPELFSKWVGESEKAVHSLFQRARVAAPSVVFFDELDGLAVSRDSSTDGVSVGDRVMSQLLVEMDGLSSRKGVTVIAATNRPDKIDAALLRPGRFDRLLYVGPPDEAARQQIFEIHTKKMPCAPDVDKRGLAISTKGYTGADIASICRESAMAALEEDLNAQEVSMRHFKSALHTVQRSVSEVSESLYTHFSRGVQIMRQKS